MGNQTVPSCDCYICIDKNLENTEGVIIFDKILKPLLFFIKTHKNGLNDSFSTHKNLTKMDTPKLPPGLELPKGIPLKLMFSTHEEAREQIGRAHV